MKLLDFAKTHKANLLPPVSEHQISQFEQDHGLKIPPRLRIFYLAAGGTEEFTEWSWRICPFDELETIESRAGKSPDIKFLDGYDTCPPLKDYIGFMDVLIEAPLYAVCANPSNSRYGEVISLAGDSNPFLAGTIESVELFESILALHWEDIILPN